MANELVLSFINKNLDFETLKKEIENGDVANFTTLLVDGNKIETVSILSPKASHFAKVSFFEKFNF